jgi:hypothetical protein
MKIWISALALSLLSLSVLAQTSDQPTGEGKCKVLARRMCRNSAPMP